MIKAKFMKAYPTEEGITYTLKGEKSKDALRAAADLQDENCIIDLAVEKIINDIDEATKILFNLIQAYGNQQYIHGREAGLREEAEKEEAIKELEI